MKKKNIKNKDLSILKKWRCKLPLDLVHLKYNRLNDKKADSEIDTFEAITRTPSPYFLKSSKKTKDFAKSFYDRPLFEKGTVTKHQTTLEHEKNDASVPEADYYSLDLAEFLTRIHYSIVGIQIQRNNKRLLRIASELSEKWTAPIGINAYFTPKNSQTLPLHFDNHEVFIMQIHGTKKWQIYDTDLRNKGKNKIIIEKILSPGDMLFIPTGYLHQAIAGDETSFHLTFGLHVFSDSIVKEWLHRKFKFDESYSLSRKLLNNLNMLYFFYRYPGNFTTSPFIVFENKKEKKLILFVGDREVHLDSKYKKELKILLKKKEVNSKEMGRLKTLLLKEKAI